MKIDGLAGRPTISPMPPLVTRPICATGTSFPNRKRAGAADACLGLVRGGRVRRFEGLEKASVSMVIAHAAHLWFQARACWPKQRLLDGSEHRLELIRSAAINQYQVRGLMRPIAEADEYYQMLLPPLFSPPSLLAAFSCRTDDFFRCSGRSWSPAAIKQDLLTATAFCRGRNLPAGQVCTDDSRCGNCAFVVSIAGLLRPEPGLLRILESLDGQHTTLYVGLFRDGPPALVRASGHYHFAIRWYHNVLRRFRQSLMST